MAFIYDSLIGVNPRQLSEDIKPIAEKSVAALKKAGSKGVLVSGIEDEVAQAVVFAINTHLKSQNLISRKK